MFGAPRGILDPVAQIVSGVAAGIDHVDLNSHGFTDGEIVFFSANECGALPFPLESNSGYYVQRVSDSRFKVSSTLGGMPITWATDGVDFSVWTPIPVDEVLELFSRRADQILPSHAVPLEGPDFPLEVVEYVALGAARALASLSGKVSEDLTKREADALERAKRWAAGVPLRDSLVEATQRTNLSVVGRAAPSGGLL